MLAATILQTTGVYGRLYRNHALLGLGVSVDAAVEFAPTGAKVWGSNACEIVTNLTPDVMRNSVDLP